MIGMANKNQSYIICEHSGPWAPYNFLFADPKTVNRETGEVRTKMMPDEVRTWCREQFGDEFVEKHVGSYTVSFFDLNDALHFKLRWM